MEEEVRLTEFNRVQVQTVGIHDVHVCETGLSFFCHIRFYVFLIFQLGGEAVYGVYALLLAIVPRQDNMTQHSRVVSIHLTLLCGMACEVK
jgi:hypothetical protein